MNRNDVLIVIGHNGHPKFVEMAEISASWIDKYQYPYVVFQTAEKRYKKYPFHMKYEMLKKAMEAFNHKWYVWMDADSFMVNPIDELFTDDYDVGVPLKEKGVPKSNQHGSHMYAGLSVWRKGLKATWTLERYGERRYSCDQKQLHVIVGKYIEFDDKFYDRAWEVISTPNFDLKLFPQDEYFHMTAIQEMRKWEDHIKIIHFKGRELQKKWDEYKRFLV